MNARSSLARAIRLFPVHPIRNAAASLVGGLLVAALAACGGGSPPAAGGGQGGATPGEAGAPAAAAPSGGAGATGGAPASARPASAAPGASAPAAGPAGAVAGHVKFAGTPPKPAPIAVTKDKEVCGLHPIVHEELVVGPGGGLENVVVSIQGAPAGRGVDAAPAELHQKGCVYRPHVSLVPVGKSLEVFNDDGILHNIHTYSTLNPPFNKAQPKFLKKFDVTFEKPETIRVACDAHQWMGGWIVVTDHPYVAVSGADGSFKIDGLAPGTYTARLWHEKLGEKTASVTVQPGQTADLTVEYR